MKKIFAILISICLSAGLAACSQQNESGSALNSEREKVSTTAVSSNALSEDTFSQSEKMSETSAREQSEMQSSQLTNSDEVVDDEHIITMTVDGQTVSITLYDTPAANALYDMLPIELDFEDFNGIEKIGYLTDILPTDGEPDGCDPAYGDFCLYAPWNNLSVFYEDFRYSEQLILLGHVDDGMDIISGMRNGAHVIFEKQ